MGRWNKMFSGINTRSLDAVVCTGAVFMLVSASGVSAADVAFNPTPFSAEMWEYDRAAPKEMVRSQVNVSERGIRAEPIGVPRNQMAITITNGSGDKTWMLSVPRSVYAELSHDGDIEPESSGVFAPAPCLGYAGSKSKGAEDVLGRRTQKWSCITKAGQAKTVHFFDPTLKVVIRSEVDGHITELRSIKEGPQPASLFQVPSNYRKVKEEELMLGLGLSKFPEANKASGK